MHCIEFKSDLLFFQLLKDVCRRNRTVQLSSARKYTCNVTLTVMKSIIIHSVVGFYEVELSSCSVHVQLFPCSQTPLEE